MTIDDKKFLDYFGDLSGLEDCRSFLLDNSYTLSFSIGDPLVFSAEDQPSLVFLVEGNIRHMVAFHSDTGSKTLAKYCHPCIFGLHTLVYGSKTNHDLICSSNCDFKVLPLSSFLSLKTLYTFVYTRVLSSVQPIEAWELLLASGLCSKDTPFSQIKRYYNDLLESLSATYVADSDELEQLFAQHSFLYLGQSQSTLDYGLQLTGNDLSDLSFPARILYSSNLKIDNLVTDNSSNNQLTESSSVTTDSFSREPTASTSLDSSDSISNSDQHLHQNIPNSTGSRIKHYPSPVDSASIATSCFRSLAFYFNLPIKPDSIRQVLAEKYPDSKKMYL